MVGTTLAEGQFEGRSGHTMRGGFRIVEADGARRLELMEDFEFDGAPAPWWGFGQDGEEFNRETMFAPLQTLTGAQSFNIPDSIDAADYDTVVLWCRAVDLLLGEGAFKG